jgi:dipeptidyl aminopeptidase/acylaminoacyl peptidase
LHIISVVPRIHIATAAVVAIAAVPLVAWSQAPDTEIFLVPVTGMVSAPSLGTPKNITNRSGYDNQPSFTPDGSAILYTSAREDAQADIYRFDIASGTTSRVTATTPESEYSATMIPGEQAISVVRVERDSAQRLWRFPLDGGAPSVILDRVEPVGYYAWADDRTLFMFVLGQPPTLRRASVGDSAATVLADSVGRSIQRIPGGGVSVVLKVGPDEWWITRVDVATNAMERLVRTRPGQEDYAWMPDGSIVLAEGATIYRWARDGEWTELATFSDPALARVSRLAVSADGKWLAIVATAEAPTR